MSERSGALIEPAVVPDVFVSGAVAIEDVGGVYRLILYADQRSMFDGSRERAIVSRLILTWDTMVSLGAALARGSLETSSLTIEPTQRRGRAN